jgi:plasmid stabilization system protein ParE
MSLSVTFRRAARAESIEAAAWYTKAKGQNLAWTYPAIHNDVRRVVANRFPFSVYFRAEERRIVVLAVFHGRRDPAIWQHRT